MEETIDKKGKWKPKTQKSLGESTHREIEER